VRCWYMSDEAAFSYFISIYAWVLVGWMGDLEFEIHSCLLEYLCLLLSSVKNAKDDCNHKCSH